jgi:hypothetical protein
MKPIKPTDRRIKAMAKRCAKVKGGITAKDIIAASGLSRDLVQKLLAQCRIQGLLVVYKPPGDGWRWMSLQDHAQTLEQVSSSRLLRRRENGRVRYHDRRSSGLIDSYNRITDPPEWEIQRRYVKAGEVPPPATRAVNSVFALGAQ